MLTNFYSDDTRIIDLTVSQLRDLLRLQIQDLVRNTQPEQDEILHGYKEIADAFGCTVSTVQKWRKKPTLKACFVQQPDSRIILASKNALLKALKKASI